MDMQRTIKFELGQSWRRSLLMGAAASIFSLMLGVLLQTAFYEIAHSLPPIFRQDSHVSLPLCNLFPDLYGCDPWVGTLTGLEIWELSLQVSQIGGLLLNLILIIILSMWLTIRTQSASLLPGVLVGLAGFCSSLILALVIHVPLSAHTVSGMVKILLLLLLPLCGIAGGQIGKTKLSRQPPRQPARFFSDINTQQVDGVVENLTERELEVLVLVAQGYKNHEIAQQLYISNATVKTHLQHIFAKLGVSNRTAAVTQALACGFLRQRANSDEDVNKPSGNIVSTLSQ